MNFLHLPIAVRSALAGSAALLLAACASSPAPTPASAAPAPKPVAAPVATGGVDYSKPDTWLCRPGRNDVCALPMSVTLSPRTAAGQPLTLVTVEVM